MKLSGVRESTNFVDETNPTGLTALRNYVGNFLYTHGITKGAGGRYYDPNVPIGTPFGGNSTPVPVDAQGRRADIDWDSNSRLPMFAGVSAPRRSNDALARSRGFKSAAQMSNFYQRQRERTAPAQPQSGSMMQQLFAIHPSVLLGHVLDKWNAATGDQ